jgi:hypothetical protein
VIDGLFIIQNDNCRRKKCFCEISRLCEFLARPSYGLLYNNSDEPISRHLRSPGLLRSVEWEFVTDVSGQPIGSHLQG